MKDNLCVLCADINYLEKTKAAISSLFIEGRWDGDFMVITNYDDEKIKKSFEEKGIYYVVITDSIILNSDIFHAAALQNHHWSTAILYRYILFHLDVFKNWEKILYLDSDMAVLDELYFMNEDHDFMAVRDMYPFNKYFGKGNVGAGHQSFLDMIKKDFDITPKTQTFNSGLFVFKPKIMTKEKREEFKKINKKYLPLASLPDQFVLNALFLHDVHFLPSYYNTNFLIDSGGNPAKVLHSLYKPKLWDKEHVFNSKWEKYYKSFNFIDIDPISDEDYKNFHREIKNNMKDVFGDLCDIKSLNNRDEKFIENFPKNGIGCEIGVGKGDYARKIFNIAKPKEMYLIDCWETQYGSGYEFDGSNYSDHKYNLKSCMFNFKQELEDQKVKIIKNYDLEVLPEFPDSYFDWVYLDGNNQYGHISEVLKILDKKVKPNGIIAGHDFIFHKWMRYGVIQAVKDFCSEKKWKIDLITSEQFRSYILRRHP